MLIATVPVNAQFIGTRQPGYGLLQLCDSEQWEAQDRCVEYVKGVNDALQMYDEIFAIQFEKMNQEFKPTYCPDTMSADLLAEIVREYLLENPEKLKKQAVRLVTLALNKAYPCKN